MNERSRRHSGREIFRCWLCSGTWALCAPQLAAPPHASPDASPHASARESTPFVVRVRSDVADVCTGTLLAPNLVLTARHCVDVAPHDEACGKSRFATLSSGDRVEVSLCDADVGACAATYRSAVIVRPQGPGGDEMCGRDAALVVLSQNIPSEIARSAEPDLSRDALRVGGRYSVVGYGARDAFGSGIGSLGRRDALQVYCSAAPRHGEPPCSAAYDMIGLTDVLGSAELVVEHAVCPGGSGGGLFDAQSVSEGAPRLVAVASRGIGSDACMISVFSHIAIHRELLLRGARTAATMGGYAIPSWAQPE